VYGGQTSRDKGNLARPNPVAALPDLKMLVLRNNTWVSLDNARGNAPPVRFGHSCVITYPYFVMYAGALSQSAMGDTPGNSYTSKDLYMYNVQTHTWNEMVTTGNEPRGVAFHTATLMFKNVMVVVGGVQEAIHQTTGPDGKALGTANSRFDVADEVQALELNNLDDPNAFQTWIKTEIDVAPFGGKNFAGRYSHSMLPLSNQSLLVLGGVLLNGDVGNDLWICEVKQILPNKDGSLDRNELNLWLLIALIASGVLFVVIIAAIFAFKHRRRAEVQAKLQSLLAGLEVPGGVKGQAGGGYTDPGATWEAVFSDQLQDAPDFIIDFASIRIVKQIGHGSTCAVYVGWWSLGRAGSLRAAAPRPVAVKRFFLENSFKREDFFRENLIHRKLRHPNVLELYAVTADPPCSVTELMWQGSLYHLLQSERDVSFGMALQFAMDAAEGMRYLHVEGVLHRDLKTLNLLVDDMGRVKVCDFGISRIKASLMTMGAGSIQYMAPEVFVSAHYTEKSDIYSYAIILWELITRETPYEKLAQLGIGEDGGAQQAPTEFMVMSEVRNGKRLAIPGTAPDPYAALIQDCWAHEPHERPVFDEIIDRLANMVHDFPTEKSLGPARPTVSPQLSHIMQEHSGSTPPLMAFSEADQMSPGLSEKEFQEGYVALQREGPSGPPTRHPASQRRPAWDPRSSHLSMRSTMSSELDFERH